jgi:ATP-dependent RNA helicase DeaD
VIAEGEEAPAEETRAEPAATDDRDGRDDRGEPTEATDGATKLFINRGRRSGLTEDDLEWALREGAVLEDSQIAAIRVLDRFSFVEVDSDVAEQTVERLDGSRLKDADIRVEVARS